MGNADRSASSLPARGARVLLRRFRPADLPAFLRYQDDPVVRRHQPGPGLDAAGAAAFVARQAELELTARGAWHAFAIEHLPDGELVGDVGVWIPESADLDEGDVGFQLDPRHHGRGLAGEALEVFLPFAFAAFRLELVTASCEERNAASRRLLERIGFVLQREGDGERHYALHRARWAERSAS